MQVVKDIEDSVEARYPVRQKIKLSIYMGIIQHDLIIISYLNRNDSFYSLILHERVSTHIQHDTFTSIIIPEAEIRYVYHISL